MVTEPHDVKAGGFFSSLIFPSLASATMASLIRERFIQGLQLMMDDSGIPFSIELVATTSFTLFSAQIIPGATFSDSNSS
ncbi:TPA: hypothetical protein J1257_003994 [Escherichia coli]|nr:hypothetical protein [Escherichia coli]